MKRKKNGFALFATIIFSLIILLIISALLFRLVQTNVEMTRVEKLDQALNLSDGAVSLALNAIGEISYGNGVYGNESTSLGRTTLVDVARKMNATDWLGSVNTKNSSLEFSLPQNLPTGTFTNQYQLGNNKYFSFKNSLLNNETHSVDFLSNFMSDSSLAASVNLLGGVSLNDMYQDLYSIYSVRDNSGKIKGEIKISLLPLATSASNLSENQLHGLDHDGNPVSEIFNHSDYMSLRVIVYIPNIREQKVTRTVDLIIVRQILSARSKYFSLGQTILAEKNIDLGNKNTSAGSAISNGTLIDEEAIGDIHSNTSIKIGVNGYINGKVTSSGSIEYLNGVIPSTTYSENCETNPECNDVRKTGGAASQVIKNTKGSQSNSDKIEIPDFRTNAPISPCTPYIDGEYTVYENCTTRSLSCTGQCKIEFRGTVKIIGNLEQKGNTKIKASGNSKVRVVVTGTIDIGGGSEEINTQPIIYISQSAADPAIVIHGNPGTGTNNGALFATTDPNSTVELKGNVGFFGAVVSAGGFKSVGNSGYIYRDKDLDLNEWILPKPPNQKDWFPKIISWKEVKP